MIVVGCGKAKRKQAAEARELYIGSLFRAGRRYAEASGQRWMILSAEHGAIAPELVIEPYERRLDLQGQRLGRWARQAASVIVLGLEHPTEEVEILAGRLYAESLAEELGRMEVRSTQPLLRLGLGFRLQKLSVMTARALAGS